MSNIPICQPTTTASRAGSDESVGGAFYSGSAAFSIAVYGGEDDEPKVETRWAACIYRDPDDSDGWWTAQIVGLMGVASEGRTREDALANLRGALSCALESHSDEEGLPYRREAYEIPQGGRILHLTL